MFSPQRIGRVFLSLLALNCLIFAACSKPKSAIDESEFTQSDESCMNTKEGCSLDQIGTGTGAGTNAGSGTGTGTASGTGTGSGLGTLTNPGVNNTDIFKQPQQTVSGQQQASCYSGLNWNYGLNGTGQSYTTDWNSFGQQGNFGQLGQPQGQQSTSAACMATGMSSTGAANLGVASYAQQNTCLSKAYQTLKDLKGNSTAPSQLARKVAILVYARCSLDLVQAQSNTFQWTTNNLTSFGYVQYYLSQFIQMLARSW